MAKGLKTGGRKAGTPNKLPASVKEAIAAAFTEVGGAAYLTKVANESPAVFCALLGKLLPLQVQGDPDSPMSIRIETVIVDPSDAAQ